MYLKLNITIVILLLGCLFNQDIFAQYPLHTKDRNLPCIEKTFYVYVHVVLDSVGTPNITENEIVRHLQKANEAFSPICISFDFCKVDTVIDYSFNQIQDEIEIGLLLSRFHKKRRLNIYFTESVLDYYTNSFSIKNGITKMDSGVIIVPKSGVGFIHELGYTFGLHHTFENKFGIENVDRTNCYEAGDLLCDTPADPNLRPDIKCEFLGKLKDPKGEFYRTEIGNYMSHFFCAHCFFTTEQYEKMAENYLTSTFKMW